MRTVTLHGNDRASVEHMRAALLRHGWEAYAEGEIAGGVEIVGVSLGERVGADAARDYAIHATIEIPENEAENVERAERELRIREEAPNLFALARLSLEVLEEEGLYPVLQQQMRDALDRVMS